MHRSMDVCAKMKSFYGLKPEINDNKTKINDRHDIKSDDIVEKI